MNSTLPIPPQLPIGQIILMMYGWISIVVYTALLYNLIRFQKTLFNSPFYKMVVYNSIADFGLFILVEFFLRARRYRYFDIYGLENPAWTGTSIFVAQQLLKNSMVLGYPIFAMNRFTAFAYPIKHKTFWKTSLIRQVNVIIWAFSLITTLPLFFEVQIYTIQPTGILQVIGVKTGMYRDLLNNGVSITTVLVCTFLYGTATYFASQTFTGESKEAKSLERKMLLCSILTFVPTIFELLRNGVDYYGHWVNNLNINIVTSELSYYVMEISTSVQCWTLLLVSPRLRSMVFQVIFRPFSMCTTMNNATNAIVSISKPSTSASGPNG